MLVLNTTLEEEEVGVGTENSEKYLKYNKWDSCPQQQPSRELLQFIAVVGTGNDLKTPTFINFSLKINY